MGVMNAVFQGTTPSSSEWLKNADRGKDKESTSSLSTLTGMLSGPDALRTFREWRSLTSPTTVTCR